jgi:hypothetical protein
VRAPKHSTFEFAFRLEPIVQVTARLFSAFEIDLVGATSDFLNMRGVVYWDLSPHDAGGITGLYFVVPFESRFRVTHHVLRLGSRFMTRSS